MGKDLIDKARRGDFFSKQEIKDYANMMLSGEHFYIVELWGYISSNKQNLLNLHNYAGTLIGGCSKIDWYTKEDV